MAGMTLPDTEDQQENPASATPFGALIASVNIADKLSKEELEKIGEEASKGFELDLRSRASWEKNIDEWTKLAKQTVEPKSYPWPKASNVKYPILSTAAMQFAARAYPSLLPSDGRYVKGKVIGKDPTGQKTKTAEAVSLFMSWQLSHEMTRWEEGMDKLLIMLPIVGTVFKKTYWDSIDKVNCSKVILPKNLVVNYWARSLEEAERVSEIIEMSERILKERIQSEVFLDVDLHSPINLEGGEIDATTPYTLIEQHTYLDLDKDGYKEPYIVTFEKESKQVLRISARFDEKGLVLNPEGKLLKINPVKYYTKFGFVPSPDGSFYDIGFGVLLGPINESVNTLINQLIDAGSLANLQGGFIGKGLRLRMGETRFAPGEWKVVNSTADDLKKQIFPMQPKDPSNVLFQLMGSLITSGKELASVAEIFVGKMPGQNTPATTTMATIEQGMKVFTAVYKRIYRSLAEEFEKLYRLNGLYVNPNTYVDVVDMEVGPEDFTDEHYGIYPAADPTAVSSTEKLLKAQGLVEMLPLGVLDPVKVAMRVLEAQEQPNWQELFIPEILESGQIPQQPDPKMIEMQMKGQLDQQNSAIKQQEAAFKSELAQRDQQFKQLMEAQAASQKAQTQEMQAQVDAAIKVHMQKIFSATAQAEHNQKMLQSKEAHDLKMQQQKEQAAATKTTTKE